MAEKLKPITVKIFFPSDMDVGPDRARWYLEGAIRGWWQQFATESDPIRQMRRATVVFPAPLQPPTPPSDRLADERSARAAPNSTSGDQTNG